MSSGTSEGNTRIAEQQLARPLEIARYLIDQKILGQYSTLQSMNVPDVQPVVLSEDISIPLARLMGIEGAAASSYWNEWKNHVQVPWSPDDLSRVPAHWVTFPGRTSLREGAKKNRHATDPVNAMLNYAYKVLESETLLVCRRYGLNPDYGILHATGEGRHAFVHDLMEPVRPYVDKLIVRFLTNRTDRIYYLNDAYFDRRWCHETKAGNCKLDPPLTHTIAGWAPEIGSMAREYALAVRRKLLYNGEI